MTWSVVDVAIICLIAYLDGGLTSPAALMLFLTLVFAATSYPLGSMVIVVVASVTGVATIGLLGGATEQAFEADPAYVWVFLVSMALSGLICMWQSRLGERQREELAELSRTDPLTGCLNRRGFSERLDAELARAGREGGEVALIQLDLNGFKAVNDRHGHAAGDELLRWVGSTLKGLLRGSDATGRLGGDEFALLLPGLGAAEAGAVAAAHRRGARRARRRDGRRRLPSGRRGDRRRAAPARRRRALQPQAELPRWLTAPPPGRLGGMLDPTELPDDLPVPEDDGATDHLPGTALPPVALAATDGPTVRLDELPGLSVVFAYPRTGRPGEESPGGDAGWNAIPGARGCTPEACSFRDELARFSALGVRVFGLSTQDTEYQREAVERLHLPYPLLSDAELGYTRALGLPTFEVEGMTLIRRLTLIVAEGRIEDVVYPVFPPDRGAELALERL